MWFPGSEGEIVEAIKAAYLIETAIFDAKAALPNEGRSKDLAIDVAAMANDGGTLLYGVGEDEHGRPTILCPIDLGGAAERVDQIVRTCISESPTVEIRAVPAEGDPGRGYLVVAVPPSPRAPHMVVVGKDHRYYGRSATGNARLTEGEVARLYERRRRWEVDREALLAEAVNRAPLGPRPGSAYLHLVARPVVTDEDLLDRAAEGEGVQYFLTGLLVAARKPEAFPQSFVPDLFENIGFVRRSGGWALTQGLYDGGPGEERSEGALDFEIGLDGGGRLFCGRAAESYNGRLLIFEDLIAGLTTRFLSVLGGIYAASHYLGPVDAGVAVTGLRGGVSGSSPRDWTFTPQPFDRDEYHRTERFSSSVLGYDPRSAARKLVSPLVRATTQERYDPFS